jgi:hypothetical protein
MSKLEKKSKRKELFNEALSCLGYGGDCLFDVFYRDFWESWYIHNTTRQPRFIYDEITRLKDRLVAVTICLVDPKQEISMTIPMSLDSTNIGKPIEEYLEIVEELQAKGEEDD